MLDCDHFYPSFMSLIDVNSCAERIGYGSGDPVGTCVPREVTLVVLC